MAGSLVKAGNREIISPSPSTPRVLDAPAPQPPHAASGRGGASGGGGEEGGHATQNSRCNWDPCRLEEQGGGQAQQARPEKGSQR
jgi:hypothetical protein